MKSAHLIMAALLLLCLAPLGYGMYQLIRFIVMVVFTISMCNYWLQSYKNLSIVFGALAILYQPFVKIALGKSLWTVVDVVVAIGLIVLWYYERMKNLQKEKANEATATDTAKSNSDTQQSSDPTTPVKD